MDSLDPYQRPPDGIRNVYKKYQKMILQDLNRDREIVDLENHGTGDKMIVINTLEPALLENAFKAYTETGELHSSLSPVPVYEHADMPGRCFPFVYSNMRV